MLIQLGLDAESDCSSSTGLPTVQVRRLGVFGWTLIWVVNHLSLEFDDQH
jgi:hypothetical protein